MAFRATRSHRTVYFQSYRRARNARCISRGIPHSRMKRTLRNFRTRIENPMRPGPRYVPGVSSLRDLPGRPQPFPFIYRYRTYRHPLVPSIDPIANTVPTYRRYQRRRKQPRGTGPINAEEDFKFNFTVRSTCPRWNFLRRLHLVIFFCLFFFFFIHLPPDDSTRWSVDCICILFRLVLGIDF